MRQTERPQKAAQGKHHNRKVISINRSDYSRPSADMTCYEGQQRSSKAGRAKGGGLEQFDLIWSAKPLSSSFLSFFFPPPHATSTAVSVKNTLKKHTHQHHPFSASGLLQDATVFEQNQEQTALEKNKKQTTIDQLLLKQSLEQTELSCWIGGSMHVCKSTVTVTWKTRICKNVSLIFQLI